MNPDTLASLIIVNICAFFVFVDLLLNLPSSRDTHASVFQLGVTASTKPQNEVENRPWENIIIWYMRQPCG